MGQSFKIIIFSFSDPEFVCLSKLNYFVPFYQVIDYMTETFKRAKKTIQMCFQWLEFINIVVYDELECGTFVNRVLRISAYRVTWNYAYIPFEKCSV